MFGNRLNRAEHPSLDIYDRNSNGAYSTLSLMGLLLLCAAVWFVRDTLTYHPSLWQELKRGDFSALWQSLSLPTANAAELANPSLDYSREINRYLAQEKFDLLEQFVTELRGKRERMIGGEWKLSAFYAGLRPAKVMNQAEWQSHLARLHNWSRLQPQSVTPLIALGDNMAALSSGVTSAEAVKQLTTKQSQVLSEGLTLTERALTTAQNAQLKDPQLYVTLLELGRLHGVTLEQLTAWFKAGTSIEAEYPYLYSNYAAYLLPHWYGQTGQSENFLATSLAQLPQGKANTLYFFAMSDLLRRAKREVAEPKLFPDLKLLQSGFNETEKTYGTDLLLLNQAAQSFSGTTDFATANRAFFQLAGRWDARIWVSQNDFNEFRNRAERGADQSLWFTANFKVILMSLYLIGLLGARFLLGQHARLVTQAMTVTVLAGLLLDGQTGIFSDTFYWTRDRIDELSEIINRYI